MLHTYISLSIAPWSTASSAYGSSHFALEKGREERRRGERKGEKGREERREGERGEEKRREERRRGERRGEGEIGEEKGGEERRGERREGERGEEKGREERRRGERREGERGEKGREERRGERGECYSHYQLEFINTIFFLSVHKTIMPEAHMYTVGLPTTSFSNKG